MDSAALLLDLHGKILRAACEHQSKHFEGLGAAGRHLFRTGTVSAKMKNQLSRLDFTCAYVRHISKPFADQFFEEFSNMLSVAQANEDLPKEDVPTVAADDCDITMLNTRLGTTISSEKVVAELDNIVKEFRGEMCSLIPVDTLKECRVSEQAYTDFENKLVELFKDKFKDYAIRFAVASRVPRAASPNCGAAKRARLKSVTKR